MGFNKLFSYNYSGSGSKPHSTNRRPSEQSNSHSSKDKPTQQKGLRAGSLGDIRAPASVALSTGTASRVSSSSNTQARNSGDAEGIRTRSKRKEEEWSEIPSPVEQNEFDVAGAGVDISDKDKQAEDPKENEPETSIDARDTMIQELSDKLSALEEYRGLYKEKTEDFLMLKEQFEDLKRDYDDTQKAIEDLRIRYEKSGEQEAKLKDNNEKLKSRNAKLADHNDKLKDSNTKLEALDGKLKDQNDRLRENNVKLREENERLKKESEKMLQDYQVQYKKLKATHEDSKRTLEHHITELTNTIFQSGSRKNTTTRDDDYFEAEFTKLVGAIQQWVFRNFRGASDVKFHDLNKHVQDSLKCTIWTDLGHLEIDVKLKELQAVVADQLLRHVFYWFPFGMPDVVQMNHGFQTIYNHIGGTDLERRSWHAQTIDMINNDSRCEEYYRGGLERMTEHLKGCLDIRVTGGKLEHRDQALFALVEQAANLAGEINREVAVFELHGLRLGCTYDPEIMEDISGILDDDDAKEQGGRVVVHKLIFPMLLRYKFDDSGRLMKKDSVVVRKATVVVMRVGNVLDEDALD